MKFFTHTTIVSSALELSKASDRLYDALVALTFRKLAAIDMALLGRVFIVAEFASGVTLAPAFGVFALLRSRSIGGEAIGAYLILLGLNYVPMLVYAVIIGTRERARLEVAEDLLDQHLALPRYRRLSLLLLVPLLVPIMVARQEWSASHERP